MHEKTGKKAGRTLRSKRLRLLLYLAAQGRCRHCGCELAEDWQADHIEPWCETHQTNVFGMQALCSRCNRQKGSKRQLGEIGRGWRSFFELPSGFEERRGQVQLWELAATVSAEEVVPWLVEFVTGYGKTLAAYGAYYILRERGVLTNMLVLVPSDDQRTQFAGDYAKANKFLGIDLTAPWVIEKKDRELIVYRRGQADIFVATYQQLEEYGGLIHDLLSEGGRWMVAYDECHHLGEHGVWAKRALALPNVKARSGYTATPIRADGAKVIGVPSQPTIRVTYAEAFAEKAVKRVVGQIGHHFLDVDIAGERTRLTTEKLEAEGFTDFSRYEVKKQLRYNQNYLNQMLIDPLRDLHQRETRHPNRNQMIVFAMTCRHADYLCGQLNILCQQMDLPYKAEWIGVGEGLDGNSKSIEENRRIVDRYKGGTGDNKPGGFHLLVQVSKAEEGFDVPDVSVLVFLNLIGAHPKLFQQIGRALRRRRDVPFDEDTASIFASAETELAQLIEAMEIQANEIRSRDFDATSPRQFGLWDIPDLVLIDSRHERTDIVVPHGVEWMSQRDRDFCEQYGIPATKFIQHFGLVPPAATPAKPTMEMTPQQSLRALQEQVKKNTSTLAFNIVQLLRRQGIEPDNTQVGLIKKSVNAAWIRQSNGLTHDAMLAEDFHRKNSWLKSMNESLMESGEVPSWVEW